MVELDPKLLQQQKKLIILEQALNYCKTHTVEKMRFSLLKELCEKRARSVGFQSYGGVFIPHLNELGDPQKSQKQRFLTIVRTKSPSGKTLSCEIFPNIARIESYLSGQRITQSFKEERIQTEVDPDLWLKVNKMLELERTQKMSATTFKEQLFKRKDDSFFKTMAADILAEDNVQVWNMTSSHRPERQMRFSESALQLMFHAARVIAGDNQFPFTLIFDYGGPRDQATIDARLKTAKSKESHVQYFTEWARLYKNILVNDNEKAELIQDKQPERLLPYLVEFHDTCARYYNTLAKSGGLTVLWDFK